MEVDGKSLRLGFLAPVNGVLNVWVGPSGNPDLAEPVTQDTGRGIRSHSWSFNNDYLLYVQDQDGDENWHLYRVDLNNGDIKDLTALEGVQAQIQEASPKFPDELLVVLNDQNPQFHSIYRINILTGDRELVQQNDGFAGFITDEDIDPVDAVELRILVIQDHKQFIGELGTGWRFERARHHP